MSNITIVNHMLHKAKGMGFVLPSQAEIPLMVAGGLAHFVNTWKALTKHTWILQAVKGFQIPFLGKPVQERKPRVPFFSTEQLAQVQEEVTSLLDKGAVTVVDSKGNSIPSSSWFPRRMGK